jgi:hypothetical protein
MIILQRPEQIWTNFSYNPKITIKLDKYDSLKERHWRYIKQNMACLDPSHFIKDIFMAILFIYIIYLIFFHYL